MSEFYCYEGLRDGGTFKVDETTKGTISSDPSQIVGKVVTLVGENGGEVGYGSGGEAPLGFVEQVEKEATNSENYVVSVVWHQIREGIPCAGTEKPGEWLVCDGEGGLKKAETEGVTNARAILVDKTDGNKVTVKID